MDLLIEKITSCIQNNTDIKDIELFKFGLKSFLNYGILLVVLLVLSIFVTKQPFYTFVFAASFFYIREFCGGIHLNSKITCFLFSLFILLGMPFLAVSYPMNYNLLQILSFLSAVSILCLAPVDHANKKIKKEEKAYFKRKLVIRWCILMVITLWIMFFKIDNSLLYVLEYSFIINFLSLVSASIKNRCSL